MIANTANRVKGTCHVRELAPKERHKERNQNRWKRGLCVSSSQIVGVHGAR